MSDQLPALIILAPLFSAVLVALVGPANHRACFPLTFAALSVSLACALGVLGQAVAGGPVSYHFGGWDQHPGIGIELRIDTINALVLAAIAFVSLLVSVYSIRRDGDDATEKTPQFHVLFLLLATGLLGMTATADAFNLFVLVEISSLTSYALIAMGSRRRARVAAFNYVIMGTIGASFFLLGVGYLYMMTGTLSMPAIREVIAAEGAEESRKVIVAFILIIVGLWIKMAFFPLYGWLPNAYSYCPTSTACLLAPLVTKVAVYVMIRMMLGVFGAEWIFGLGWSRVIVWLAVLAILAGAFLALAQVELKKMLSYLIVMEVGYMVGGAWLANHWGMAGAIYHILSDALMTLCLFLGASILFKKTGARRLEDLDGMFGKMPLTMAGFAVGALAMIGVPPTCGFFSKFYLIRGGIEAGHWEYVIALVVSSLVNAVLFFRIFEIAWFGKSPAAGHAHGDHHGEEPASLSLPPLREREGPPTALAPLLATALAILLLGLGNGQVVEWIQLSLQGMPHVGPPH